jgi:hypothetical protein
MPYPPQGSGGVSAHNLLSSVHLDTSAGTAVAGDMIAANSVPKWARLPVGSSGQVLTVVSGAPAWATPSGGGGGVPNAADVWIQMVRA